MWCERLNVGVGGYAKSSGYWGLIWVVIVESFGYKSEVGSMGSRFTVCGLGEGAWGRS